MSFGCTTTLFTFILFLGLHLNETTHHLNFFVIKVDQMLGSFRMLYLNFLHKCLVSRLILSRFLRNERGRKFLLSPLPWSLWCTLVRTSILKYDMRLINF